MMMLWAWAGVPLGVYNIAKGFNMALQIQPQILTFLSLMTWIQCHYYEQVGIFRKRDVDTMTDDYQKWTVVRSLAVVIPVAFLMGGIQAGLIVGVKRAREKDIEWPAIVMAVASAALLAAGVLRHYLDIYLHRTVRGISFIFVGIDALGDVFSLVSVVFQPTLDVLGMVVYGTELVLWIGVFLCGAHYNLIPWLRGKGGKSEDEQVEDGHSASAALGVGQHSAAVASGIALHDLPSSTSVFRTPSGGVGVTR
jgi:hypothetical protein